MTPPAREQVGLALRADRRRRGESQRAYAASRGLSRSLLSRAEVDASGLRLKVIVGLLEGTGCELVIRPIGDGSPDPWWDHTDVEARTRFGARFPAHREVRRTRGPYWWAYHEELGNRLYRPAPKWTAEHFETPPGTRYGKPPRDPGFPRGIPNAYDDGSPVPEEYL